MAACLCVSSMAAENWPQASGPNANWKVDGNAATRWSVVGDENVAWRSELPEGGQSAVTVWGDRLFLTCHREVKSSDEAKRVTDIVGYCLDADDGRVLWTVDLPGSVAVGTAGIFSDATVFAPVTDGAHVWFFNRSGSIGCFDFSGKKVWLRKYTPRNRHTNRQCEPILFGDQIITVEVADKAAGAKIARHQKVPSDIDARAVWTCLHGIDKTTGDVIWIGQAGTVCHHTPMIGQLTDGTPAIVNARGGGHKPLETPYGISLTSLASGREGTILWSTELPGFDPSFNGHWDQKYVYAFYRTEHVLLDTASGEVVSSVNLQDDVDFWRHLGDGWQLEEHSRVAAGKRHANTNQANIVVGPWHYFLAHDVCAIGRVNVESGKVEYLQVPAQLAATPDNLDRRIWEKRDAIPIETTNARGVDLGLDKRARGSGWGHVSAASPTLVGQYLYFPTMTGTVYVIDTKATSLGTALVAVNDLGPAGKTWTLSSFSYADGSLFVRTMKEVIRIDRP